MAKQNALVKGWKYLMALFSFKIDEYADPKVQIQQAIEDAQQKHAALTQQAAAVIGNQKQLEMQLSRTHDEVKRAEHNAEQAVILADRARAAGDEAKAQDYENTATSFANELATAEATLDSQMAQHAGAVQAAEQARTAVANNEALITEKLAESKKLLSQLEQAKMQESVAATLQSMGELAAPGNTPTLDAVRDRIEKRYANAVGASDLASNSLAGRRRDVEAASRQMAGSERLEAIKAKMRGGTPAVTTGDKPEAVTASTTATADDPLAAIRAKVDADKASDVG